MDLLSKYAWVIPIKDLDGTSIDNAFKKIISKERKPNKIWLINAVNFILILLKIF